MMPPPRINEAPPPPPWQTNRDQGPTLHERQIAMCAYLVGIPMPIIGPLIFMAVGSESLFIKKHAIRGIIEGAIYHGLMILVFLVVFAGVFAAAASSSIHAQPGLYSLTPITFLALIMIIGLLYLVHIIRACWLAHRAYNGYLPTWNGPGN